MKNPYRWVNLNREWMDLLPGDNAYGDILFRDPEDGRHLKVMCGHGGSMYCCGSCAKAMMKGEPAPKLPCPVHPKGLQMSTMRCNWPECAFNRIPVEDLAAALDRKPHLYDETSYCVNCGVDGQDLSPEELENPRCPGRKNILK